MKQVAQNYKSGELALVDAPVPRCGPGGVLVRTEYSLISAGTEMMKVGEAKLSMLGKVRARPDQVKKVLETMAQQGPQATFKKVMNKLDSYTPLGYSLCGVVIEVGAGVTDFQVGQRVACAGNLYALHAEINWVPVNLCVPVPDGVDPRHAAFTTVGAVAMQGLRQGNCALGEIAVVVGLGLIGQILVQLLKASGVKVLGIDISDARCKLAEANGAICADAPNGAGLDRLTNALAEVSNGFGADAIFLSAGGSTNEPVELAAKLARDKGRVIDIGKCSLDLPWNAYYDKELDVRFSRSYGPGRYDTLYEEQGIDYPIGYVRWSEGRNLGCFVDLLASKSIDMEPLISAVKPFAEAKETYEALDAGSLRGVGFLFEYPEHVTITRAVERAAAAAPTRATAKTGVVKVGFIGAGNYASTMLLPHLIGRSDVQLAHVATSSGLSAVSAQRKFGFQTAGTDYKAVLEDTSIDSVFIVTRHSSHARMVCEALRAGKTVFVEKPLAITMEQLDQVMETVRETGNDRIMVGFNRRFAPMLVDLKDKAGRRSQPALLRYLVNAGKMEATSWYAQSDAEGTRFCGEGGHFIDTMAWWVGADPVAVSAARAGAMIDDVHVTVTFGDGSIGVVTYTTVGARKFQKETFEVVADGRVARCDNFASSTLFSGEKPSKKRALGPDKGQKAEVEAFLAAARTGSPMPVPLRTVAAVTAATIAVDESIASAATVKLPSWV